MMELTREYYEAVRDCTPEDCGDCILQPETNRACHMVDIDPRDEAAFVLALMDERDRYRVALERIQTSTDGEWHGTARGCFLIARAALKPAQKEAAHAEAGQ